MYAMRLIVGSVIATATFFAGTTPANAFLAPTKPGHHLDSLHKAAHELKHAHGEVGKNGGKAAHHVSAAIGHIEHAIQLHKSALTQNRTGLNGALASAAHHHHHSQLHEALHAAKEAEKHIAAGNATHAAHEIARAHHHVELAMHSHHHLIGK
jgi:hypothetical protein